MIIDDEDSLKTWIMKDVASLTDADADRLALYVIALLKKPLSDNDLPELCLEKLDVFLQSHTKDFVERLFQCLKDGSYLPEGAHTAAVEDLVLTDGSDQEEDLLGKKVQSSDETAKNSQKSSEGDTKEKRDFLAPDHGDKRATSAEKERTDARSSANNSANAAARPPRRRISPPSASSGTTTERYSGGGRGGLRPSPPRSRRSNLPPRRTPPRSGRSDRYYRRRSYSRSKSRSRSPHREKRRDDHESSGRRHRCRDFHEKGFCMRGDKCNYDHGPDPVVIENAALEKIVSRAGATAAVATSVSPAAALYSPTNPPPPGVDRGAFGAVSEPYNPEAPALTGAPVGGMDFSVPPPPLPPHLASAVPAIVPVVPSVYPQPAIAPSSSTLVTVVPNVQTVQAYNPAGILATSMTGVPQDPSLSNTYNNYNTSAFAHHGGGGGPHMYGSRRGGRGRYRPYGSGPLVNPALCSLLVKKIPPEQNKIVTLDQHFGKFGQITNLHVQYEGQPDTALVTFKSRREALAAYKSTEPIFNNRFIKVYWQTQPPDTTTTENGDAAAQQHIPVMATGANAQQLSDSSLSTNHSFSKTFSQGANSGLTENEGNVNSASDADANQQQSDKPESVAPRAFAVNTGPKRGVYNQRAVAAKKKAEKDNILKLIELHRMKTELYKKQIEQQKDLLRRIQATDNKELKKKLMELVKMSEESMKAAKSDLESLGKQISSYQERQKQQTEAQLVPKSEPVGDGDDTGEVVSAEHGNSGDTNGNSNVTHKSADKSSSQESGSDTASVISKISAANKKKLFRVLLVSGCPSDLYDELIVHMEKFGELFDFDITPRNSKLPCMFTYKDPTDAQRAVSEATKSFTLATIDVDWAPVSLGHDQPIVPDGQRNPNEQMTPAALLASLEYEEEEEEDDEEDGDATRNTSSDDQKPVTDTNSRDVDDLEDV